MHSNPSPCLCGCILRVLFIGLSTGRLAPNLFLVYSDSFELLHFLHSSLLPLLTSTMTITASNPYSRRHLGSGMFLFFFVLTTYSVIR